MVLVVVFRKSVCSLVPDGRPKIEDGAYLGESDVCGSLAEALTADVESILADETSWMGADTAMKVRVSLCSRDHFHFPRCADRIYVCLRKCRENAYHSREPFP